MEPFSVTAAAIALCPIIIESTRYLRKAARTIKYARSEILKLSDEMMIFAGLFGDYIDAYHSSSKTSTGASAPTRRLIAYTKSAIRDYKALASNVQALINDPRNRTPTTQRIIAYIKWFFSSNAVNCLRASLSVARESINSVTNIQIIQKLDAQLSLLRNIATESERMAIEEEFGMTVEQCMRMIKSQIQNRRVMRHEIDKRLHIAEAEVISLQDKAKNSSESVPQMQRLIGLINSVEEFVEETLPLRESGNRTSFLSRSNVIDHPEKPASRPSSTSPSTRFDPDIPDHCSACAGPCMLSDSQPASSPAASTPPPSLPPIAAVSPLPFQQPTKSSSEASRDSWRRMSALNIEITDETEMSPQRTLEKRRKPNNRQSTVTGVTIPGEKEPSHGSNHDRISKSDIREKQSEDDFEQGADELTTSAYPELGVSNSSMHTSIHNEAEGNARSPSMRSGMASSSSGGALSWRVRPHAIGTGQFSDASFRGSRSVEDEGEDGVIDESDGEDDGDDNDNINNGDGQHQGRSPFQPVAGVQGQYPRNWRNRHQQRRDSPQEFPHRR